MNPEVFSLVMLSFLALFGLFHFYADKQGNILRLGHSGAMSLTEKVYTHVIGVTANIYADVLQKQKVRLADTIDDKLSDALT